MKTINFYLTILLVLLFVACLPRQSGTNAPAAAASSTAVPALTVTPMLTKPAPATAVPTLTRPVDPTTEPRPTRAATSQPAADIDQYALARQILEQANFFKLDEWTVQPCEGDAAILCINKGSETVGFAELILYPLRGYAEDHPVRVAAVELPAAATAYTADDFNRAQQALVGLAEEYLEIFAADRAITYPEDTFTSLGQEPVQMGALPGLAFGFVHTNESGTVQERYLNIAAFDQQFIYWLGINYDPAYIPTFVSDTAVTEFTPFFYEIAAQLPIHQPTQSALPELIPAMSLSGYFPEGIDWSLATELPEAATAVAVLSQPAQFEPLTAEQSATTAQKYGFDDPLYVEYRTGFSTEALIDMGMFIAFDGPRNLALWGQPYFYNDATYQSSLFDLPFNEAAPIAEQFLKENGWLTFPYEMVESEQGEGVLFLPIVDGVLLSAPAYGVRVAGDGGVSNMFIYPQDNLDQMGLYPILTAEAAWQQILADPNQPGIFYQIDPPPLDLETAVTHPLTYNRLPAPGEAGTVYNNIWVYQPLAGDGLPIIVSSDYFRIIGDEALLAELAAETDYLVKLSGTVQEDSLGLQSLDLAAWELVPDAGGLPLFYGQIMYEGDQPFLVDSANRTTYLLPDAPSNLPTDRETAVAGLPEMVDGVETLNWQEITTYPLAAETILPRPTDPMQTVTVDSVRLVYLQMPALVSGLADHLFFPAWQFAGVADNGEQVNLWVTAVSPEFITK